MSAPQQPAPQQATPAPPAVDSNFLTDAQRRVLANLSVPRSSRDLSRVLSTDAYAPFDRMQPFEDLVRDVTSVLRQLEARELVKNTGQYPDGQTMVAAVRDDDELPTLHEEKAKQLRDRLKVRGYKLTEGDHWYWTERGRSLLVG